MIGPTVNYDHDQSLKKLCAAIYDRTGMEEARGRGGEKRKGERGKEKEREKSAENLNRPAEGRYVPLHLSSRPVPVPRSCTRMFVVFASCVHVLVLVLVYVRSHMSTKLSASREGCFSVREA